ncbi:lipoprotein-releasing ABC transporter permease subunit [Alteromonas aestuariivivens]|uniref:Lipoprotein-releasing ABC transporter permease subunit n=1 Tax=Alteromonas aestuariivivens TaxID=1938339 RepID=A0A3D8MAQ4_9ALTE|nr:lipoprotein-releasing ABC transporter permease subunit [Alteromonas aestuariivivens]RDV27444.1 lipoprotein-releasing ABC transporter permease subunit [Alteromonas aestuariivivens]
MNLAWKLARRFRRGKQQSRFVSFISFSSTFGVGLGCFVLITLLSIMNGFEHELTQRILSVIPHGELYSVNQRGIADWQEHQRQFQQREDILKVEPYTKITGMLQHKGALKAVELTGMAYQEQSADAFSQEVDEQDWQRFLATPDGVLLGNGIMQKLSLDIGDNIQILIPTVTDDLSFKAPKTVKLTIAGRLIIGGELDNYLGIMHLSRASEVAGIQSGAQGLRFTLENPFGAYATMREIGFAFPQAVYMSDWTRTQGHLYQDIQLVRTVVYIALTLVIAVACFNIVSTLVMSVREKRAAIAILKTMGADDGLIRQTFVIQGVLNGVIGIVAGTGMALLIAPNLSAIVAWLESLTGITLLSGDVYFINFLPSQLHWQDVAFTVLIAFVLCVVATLYPAQRAVRVSPARALNG